jgi:hypothetical protein
MLNHVKSFGEIKFEDDDLSSGFMTLMKKFKSPGEAVQNCPTSDETILVLMDDVENHLLKAVGTELS